MQARRGVDRLDRFRGVVCIVEEGDAGSNGAWIVLLASRLVGGMVQLLTSSCSASCSAAQQLSNSAHTSSAAEHGKCAPGLRTICAERNTIMPTTTSRPHTHMEDTAARTGGAGVKGRDNFT